MELTANLNLFDRLFRLAVGSTCIFLGFFEGSLISNQLVAVLIGVFGITNIFAFFTAHCPVYAACGISTIKGNNEE